MLAVINLIIYFRTFKARQQREAELKYEQYYEQLLDNVEDVIQVIDINGKVKFSTASVQSLIGYTTEETKSMDPFIWIHPQDKERIKEEFKHIPSGPGASYQTQYRVVTKSGEIKHVETRVVNALANPEVEGFIATERDITLRITAEEKLRIQNLSYQLLLEMSKSFLRESLNNALPPALSSLGKYADVDRVYVYLLNKKQDHWICLHEWRSNQGDKIQSVFYESGVSFKDLEWVNKEFQNNRIINIEHLADMPPEAQRCKEMFESDHTQSILLLPMQVMGRTIGFIGYDTLFATKKWQDDDITTLRICNEILTSAVLRHEAEQSTKESLSFNKGIIESTAEGILLTDLNDNIVTYNSAFKKMWMIDDQTLLSGKKSTALKMALKGIENTEEVFDIITQSDSKIYDTIQLIARFKNKRVLECISVPQVIDGIVVGRIWSNRDITDRVNSEREEIEKGVAQAQFESLKNQVNPHFLFNSLNVLSSLVHIDPDLSEKFIDQLARSYRYLLEQKDKELVPLKTEIEFVQSFSFLLKIRFEEKLKINIKLPAEAMNDLIAPLTLQLLIENAVKHNTVSLEEPLIIDLFMDSDKYLVVKNNLQIRVQRMPSTGLGLKNIINRYKLLTNAAPEFQVLNDTYIARIPLIKNS
jgi:PAS domain S-box-containing protein